MGEFLDIKQADRVIGIYSRFPYRDAANCYDTRKICLVNIWVMEGNGQFVLSNYLFPNKVQKNLNNCPIRVSTTKNHPFVENTTVLTSSGTGKLVYDKGWDISLLNIIKEAMNISLHFLPPSTQKQGRFLKNGTFTGIIGDLTYSTCDIAVAGIPLIPPFTYIGDYTRVYYRSEYIWLVPCAKRIPGWRNIFRMFSSTLLLCVFMSIFLAVYVTYFLAKCNVFTSTPQVEGYSKMLKYSCDTVAVFLGTAVPSVPRSWTQRIFLLSWICYCLAVNTVIQSFLACEI
jgi:hypothetical protein